MSEINGLILCLILNTVIIILIIKIKEYNLHSALCINNDYTNILSSYIITSHQL